MRTDNIQSTLASLEVTWKDMLPEYPFSVSFLDQDIARQYEIETRWRKIVQTASWLTVLVACLGVFGLAAFAGARRTKEIGIRKVVGASAYHLFFLLSREYLLQVIVAGLVACPFVYYAMNNWLQEFAYRVEMQFDVLAIGIVATFLVVLGTLSYHVVKALRINPVDSLRYE